MTPDAAIQKARRIHADLERNADDIHFDRVDWDTFEARNRSLWDQAKTNPRVNEMVLGLLRNDPDWQTPEERTMSKRKIDETMTQARNARAKRAKETPKATESEASAEAATPETALEDTVGRPTKGKPKPKEIAPKEKEPREDLVVFAFRLTTADRDLIHKAAGAAKASRYARTLLVAASKGDVKLVSEITAAIGAELNASS